MAQQPPRPPSLFDAGGFGGPTRGLWGRPQDSEQLSPDDLSNISSRPQTQTRMQQSSDGWSNVSSGPQNKNQNQQSSDGWSNLSSRSEEKDWAAALADSPKARADTFKAVITRKVIEIPRVKLLAARGIPEEYRASYWAVLLKYLPKDRDTWPAVRAGMQEKYNVFVKEFPVENAKDFPEAKEVLRRIDMDIPRTMPSLHFFASHEGNASFGDDILLSGNVVHLSPRQLALRRVLYVFCRLNPGLGYVQGMNELVAHLFYPFTHMCTDPTEPEAMAFHTFQSLMTHLGDNFCRALDKEKGTGVGSTMRVFQALVATADPFLYRHLHTLGVMPEFYAFRWITLFMSQEFQVPDVLRIWDYLFSDLENVRCMVYYVAVAMLTILKDMLASQSFGEVIMTLQQYPPEIDVDAIIRVAEHEIRPALSIELVEYLHEHEDACKAAMDTAIRLGSTPPSLRDSLIEKKEALLKEAPKLLKEGMDSLQKWLKKKT